MVCSNGSSAGRTGNGGRVSGEREKDPRESVKQCPIGKCGFKVGIKEDR